MIDPADVHEFLSHPRLAVIGASPDPKNFGTAIYKELKSHGYDPVPVNPNVAALDVVDGDRCYPDVASVPGGVDGAIVMVPAAKAADVVGQCIAAGVPRVWLFKGAGGAGAVSEAAVELCRQHGVPVIDGACPLMFLEPVGFIHRIHRGFRRLNGSLARSA